LLPVLSAVPRPKLRARPIRAAWTSKRIRVSLESPNLRAIPSMFMPK